MRVLALAVSMGLIVLALNAPVPQDTSDARDCPPPKGWDLDEVAKVLPEWGQPPNRVVVLAGETSVPTQLDFGKVMLAPYEADRLLLARLPLKPAGHGGFRVFAIERDREHGGRSVGWHFGIRMRMRSDIAGQRDWREAYPYPWST